MEEVERLGTIPGFIIRYGLVLVCRIVFAEEILIYVLTDTSWTKEAFLWVLGLGQRKPTNAYRLQIIHAKTF
jgi:hypothetical protein